MISQSGLDICLEDLFAIADWNECQNKAFRGPPTMEQASHKPSTENDSNSYQPISVRN